MMEIGKEIVGRLFSVRLFGGLLAGIIIAAILTAVIGVFTGAIRIGAGEHWPEIVDGHLLTPLFASAFGACSVLFYVLTYKEREDILTPLRRRLKGIWRIEYQNWIIDQAGGIHEVRRMDVCYLGIEESTAKLFIVNEMPSNQFFKPHKIRIDDITLNPALNPKRMIYYYELNLDFRSDVMTEHRLGSSSLTAPICVVLTIDEPATGRWSSA